MASQSNDVSIVYWTNGSVNQKTQQSSPSMDFVRWFPSQTVGNVKIISIWWRHYVLIVKKQSCLDFNTFIDREQASNSHCQHMIFYKWSRFRHVDIYDETVFTLSLSCIAVSWCHLKTSFIAVFMAWHTIKWAGEFVDTTSLWNNITCSNMFCSLIKGQ